MKQEQLEFHVSIETLQKISESTSSETDSNIRIGRRRKLIMEIILRVYYSFDVTAHY